MVLTGNPLRPELFTAHDIDVVRTQYGFNDNPIVLMFGGSLGAEKMNEALVEMVTEGYVNGFNLIASTGERHFDGVMEKIKEKTDLDKIKNISYKAVCIFIF